MTWTMARRVGRHPVAGAAMAAWLLACGGTPGGAAGEKVDAEHLHRAMQHLTDVIVYDIFSPPQAARTYAYSAIAAYEALAQGDTSLRSLAGQVRGFGAPPPAPPGTAAPVVALRALMTVGHALTFSRDRMDSLRAVVEADERAAGVDAGVIERSRAHGDAIAQHVLAWAAQDGYRESRSMPRYTVTGDPGRWIPTPPAYMDAVEPNWATLRPFVLDSAAQYRPATPHPYTMAAGSPFRRQVEEVYRVGRGLTDEERAIAAFWDCNPYVMHVQGHTMFATKKISPGGHWMGIVAIASRLGGADIGRAAEAYAKTAIALSDGFVSSWEVKYSTNVVRPETVINRELDAAWQPLLQTPPFPEYTSGHSVISSAAAVVLGDLFGDSLAFTDSVEVRYGLPARHFASFAAAAREASISRLYGGIHYRQAIEEGQEQGAAVGRLVAARLRTRGAAPGLRADSTGSR